jgi:hypothetical protein
MWPYITARQIEAKLREENRRLDRKLLRKIPATLPPGRVVVHNSAVPDAWTPSTPLGLYGFRAWTQIATDEIEECSCQWSSWLGKHYRVAGAKPPPDGDYSDIGILRPFTHSRA